MGPSQDLGLFKWQEAKEKPLTLFCNNVAHSYGRVSSKTQFNNWIESIRTLKKLPNFDG
jgi:hypothetical protein